MKKTCIFLLLIGGALVLWGIVDVYNWATTGKQLIELYPDVSSIAELVRYSLLSGIIKAILGMTMAAATYIISKKAG